MLETKEFISNQNDYGAIPYGKKGTIANNGCGSIACHNYLRYNGYDNRYFDAYKFFNKGINLIFRGRWGTNPFAVERYLKKKFRLKVNMYFFRVPKKRLKSSIVLYIYKHNNKLSAHYVFGFMDRKRFKTYNLNHSYSSIENMLKKENAWGKMFVVYEIKKK